MLNSHQIIAELKKLGFVLEKDNARIKGLVHPETQVHVYVKAGTTARPVGNAPLVVHPDYLDRRQVVDTTGVKTGQRYHNSNMTEFPRRKHGGDDAIAYGFDIDVPSISALQRLVLLLSGAGSIDVDADIRAAGEQLAELDDTIRQQVIDARRGQGRFRADLMRTKGARCCVTGVAHLSLLRASHIKPWRDSSNNERLDPDNGLLLVASLDAAFDAGLISFGDDSAIQISPQLTTSDAQAAGINIHLAISKPLSVAQKQYLQYHRDQIFRK